MSVDRPHIECAGCGATLAATTALPFACPDKVDGDDIDHVLSFTFDTSDVSLPERGDNNPFIRYRRLLWTWHAAMLRGMSDDDYVGLVTALDGEIAAIDGHGFSVTPYRHSAAHDVHYKDETHNVAGSHKARHLMGIALHLAVLEACDAAPWTSSPPLAIASCGNAALAAAVVAKAASRALRVFIPTWADPGIVARLRELGAELHVCERRPGDPPGDPCYHQFRAAVAGGALPFTCQGSENGLTIDGGRTLGFELAAQHAASGAAPLSHLFIQVGGGALASATYQALAMAHEVGAMSELPALMAVQSEGGHPLHRAWLRLSEGKDTASRVDQARRHRSGYMWPWENEPKSIADGILDDETYDWWQIVRALAETGGRTVLASEADFERAYHLAHEHGINASHTGVASFAGLLAVRDRGALGIPEPAVLFTGAAR